MNIFQSDDISVVSEKPVDNEKRNKMIEVIGENDNACMDDDLSDHEDDPIWKLAATVGSTI